MGVGGQKKTQKHPTTKAAKTKWGILQRKGWSSLTKVEKLQEETYTQMEQLPSVGLTVFPLQGL